MSFRCFRVHLGRLVLLVLLAAAFAIGRSAAVPAAEADPTGVWLIENDDAAVQIYRCGAAFCGRVVWLKSPVDETGRPRRDRKNAMLANQSRPICGLPVLENLVPAGAASWDRGSVYNPLDGRSYDAGIRLRSPSLLEVRAQYGIFGRTQIWRRADAALAGAVALGCGSLPTVASR